MGARGGVPTIFRGVGAWAALSLGALGCQSNAPSSNERRDAGTAAAKTVPDGGSPTALGLAQMNRIAADPTALPEAMRLFEEALKRDPGDASAAFGLGWALQMKGEVDRSVSQYRRAIWLTSDKGPRDIEYFAHYNLGIVYGQKGLREAALGEFSLAAAADPTSWTGLYNLGLQMVALQCLPAATVPLRRAVLLHPKEAAIRYELGIALWKSGERAPAETEFAEAVKLQPSMAGTIERFKSLSTPAAGVTAAPPSAKRLKLGKRPRPR